MCQIQLGDFSRFLSRASYYSTWSNPRKFLIDRDVIHSEKFIQFIFYSTTHSPHQFSDNHEVTQSISSFWNYIQR